MVHLNISRKSFNSCSYRASTTVHTEVMSTLTLSTNQSQSHCKYKGLPVPLEDSCATLLHKARHSTITAHLILSSLRLIQHKMYLPYLASITAALTFTTTASKVIRSDTNAGSPAETQLIPYPPTLCLEEPDLFGYECIQWVSEIVNNNLVSEVKSRQANGVFDARLDGIDWESYINGTSPISAPAKGVHDLDHTGERNSISKRGYPWQRWKTDKYWNRYNKKWREGLLPDEDRCPCCYHADRVEECNKNPSGNLCKRYSAQCGLPHTTRKTRKFCKCTGVADCIQKGMWPSGVNAACCGMFGNQCHESKSTDV